MVKKSQEDDDFEPLIQLKRIWLSIKKVHNKNFIRRWKDSKAYDREPKVDVTPLKNGKTTATYTHPKDPLLIT